MLNQVEQMQDPHTSRYKTGALEVSCKQAYFIMTALRQSSGLVQSSKTLSDQAHRSQHAGKTHEKVMDARSYTKFTSSL